MNLSDRNKVITDMLDQARKKAVRASYKHDVDADDVFQNIAVKMAERLDKLPDDTKYAYEQASFAARDGVRHTLEQFYRVSNQSERKATPMHMFDAPEDDRSGDPVFRAALMRNASRLTRDQILVALRVAVCGMTIEECAESMGLKREKTRVTYKRALDVMRGIADVREALAS